MKDFKNFGVKRRSFPEYNYNALWCNLKTIRTGEGVAKELPADRAEFYDVGINTKCNAECDFCYVSASHKGKNYEDICETWEKWMKTFPEDEKLNGINVRITEKPFQIAIGSTGEATIHPDFTKFLNTVYHSRVVPNYTTNGIILSEYGKNPIANTIMEATSEFVGGVAVSFGNPLIRQKAKAAVTNLLKYGNTNVNIHHLISDRDSVDEFISNVFKYGDEIAYHVLLPLMPAGRSTKGIDEGVWEYLETFLDKENIKNVAFGAHFVDYLKNSKIKTWLYPPESLSKNVILEKDCVKITPSSFNLNPIKIINL
jgi:hypothetical protein